MKKTVWIVMFVVMGFLISNQAWAKGAAHARGRERAREGRQHGRIAEGVKSGELTKGEAKGLRTEERHIDNMRDRALADGKLSAGEKVRIEHAQDKASQNIYQAKHNDKERS